MNITPKYWFITYKFVNFTFEGNPGRKVTKNILWEGVHPAEFLLQDRDSKITFYAEVDKEIFDNYRCLIP